MSSRSAEEKLADELLHLLKAIHDVALETSSDIRFDGEHPRHQGLIALYGTMIELCGSIIILIDNRMAIGVPILTRSILEAFVDFTNLNSDEGYAKNMHASYLKERRKTLNAAKDGENEFLALVAKLRDLDDQIHTISGQLNDLKKEGRMPLQIEEKFRIAKLKHVYKSVYAWLCNHSHNNLHALSSRHIDVSDGLVEFVYYKGDGPEASMVEMDTIAGLLLSAMEQIRAALEVDPESQGYELQKQLESCRDKFDSIS